MPCKKKMTPLAKNWSFLCYFHSNFFQAASFHSFSSLPTLENSIKTAIGTKKYEKIPDLLIVSKEYFLKSNPFSFLSTFPHHLKTQIIDEILQSFLTIKPRQCPQTAYSLLLTFSLQNPNPLPLAFAILQRTLRSGCSPVPQTHLSLSNAWLDRRRQSDNISKIILEMKLIGYEPDTDTCNYLIVSLCAVDRLTEAVNVLKGMSGAGCVPDLESYDHVICKMCRARKIQDLFEMVKNLVENVGLAPRETTILKMVRAMRAKREIWRAVEVIEILERADLSVGFEIYELVFEGCLQYREYVLAGKIVMRMADRGFIPFIEARQKVVEGLAIVGEFGFASAVRQKFVLLDS